MTVGNYFDSIGVVMTPRYCCVEINIRKLSSNDVCAFVALRIESTTGDLVHRNPYDVGIDVSLMFLLAVWS